MSSLPEPADIDPKDVDATGELMARARRVLAYGGLDGIVQRPLYYDRSASLGDRSASLGDRSALGGAGVFPQFAVAAEGCHLTDSIGQTFVDWVNGWGPVLLGYRHPKVEA